jgi:hypothetical protein
MFDVGRLDFVGGSRFCVSPTYVCVVPVWYEKRYHKILNERRKNLYYFAVSGR